MRQITVSLLLSALILACPGPAGPSPARADPSDKFTAKSYFRLGKTMFKRGAYRKAIEAFQTAYRHWTHRVIYFNIALCYEKLGDLAKAGEYVRKFLRKAKDKERRLPKELRRVQLATGLLVIRAPQSNLDIFVDGKRVGAGSVSMVVTTGSHTVELREGDHLAARKSVTIAGDGQALWAPAAKELTARPRPRVVERRVVVPPPPPKKPRRAKGVHWAAFVATAAVAVVLAGGALGTGIHAKGLVDDYRRDHAAGLATTPQRDKAVNGLITTNVLWGVAGAAAITAGVLLFFTRWKRAEAASGAAIQPVIGPGQLGLQVKLRY